MHNSISSPGFRKSINREGRRCLQYFSGFNSSQKVTIKLNEADLVFKVCSWLNYEYESYPGIGFYLAEIQDTVTLKLYLNGRWIYIFFISCEILVEFKGVFQD